MTALVLVETSSGGIATTTRSAIAAARLFGNVHVLVAGFNNGSIAGVAAELYGVEKVLRADANQYAHHLAEPLADLIVGLAPNYSHIVAAATANAHNVLPRVAALLDVEVIPDIIAIESNNTFIRPIYAGNALAIIRSEDTKKVISVRPTSFAALSGIDERAPIEIVTSAADPMISKFLGEKVTQRDSQDLLAARIVISGGRGVSSFEQFRLLSKLAERLGAAVGASRAAVDAGYAPNDLQVGQSGKLVAPELYIAVGISGAIQHLAGMKDSKFIVAINHDEKAPIFSISDYGLVADLSKALPALYDALSNIALR